MKRSPLKRQSDKRRNQNQKYRRLAAAFLAQNPFCQICKKDRSTQVHHKAGRNGLRLNVTQDWLALCNHCHDQVHKNGTWARDNGYIVT